MHYLLLTFSLILHYLYRYICILNDYYENDGYSADNSNPLIIIIST